MSAINFRLEFYVGNQKVRGVYSDKNLFINYNVEHENENALKILYQKTKMTVENLEKLGYSLSEN